ncbi:MAG TPA: hypothetical protein PKE40_02045 [Arachnia sp.]|nr:hypothetical protein [Arachnia sp.]HMT85111.1 hypothetical protein [Arachnia sp.]
MRALLAEAVGAKSDDLVTLLRNFADEVQLTETEREIVFPPRRRDA